MEASLSGVYQSGSSSNSCSLFGGEQNQFSFRESFLLSRQYALLVLRRLAVLLVWSYIGTNRCILGFQVSGSCAHQIGCCCEMIVLDVSSSVTT